MNKNCKNVRRQQIITNWTHHAIITLLYWWKTHNRKWLQTNDTSIWIVTNIFSVEIYLQCLLWSLRLRWQLPIHCYHHCTCCNNYESCFFISLKLLACIASLQSDICPSKLLIQPWITSSTAPLPILKTFAKQWK